MDTSGDKLGEGLHAFICAMVALLCFSCSSGLKAFRPLTGAEGEWFVALVVARFSFIVAGFALIVVAVVKLVKAL